jgi:hypothetical protein
LPLYVFYKERKYDTDFSHDIQVRYYYWKKINKSIDKTKKVWYNRIIKMKERKRNESI